MLIRVSPSYTPVKGRLHTCYAPVRHSHRPLLIYLPFDLHVLGLPLAFILSQDQTLHCNNPMAILSITRSPVIHPSYRRVELDDPILFVLNPYQIPFKELQKRITTSLVHENHPLSSESPRVRYQLSIIQRTSCLLCPSFQFHNLPALAFRQP